MAASRQASQLAIYQHSDIFPTLEYDSDLVAALCDDSHPSSATVDHKQNLQLAPSTPAASASSPRKADSSPPPVLPAYGPLDSIRLTPPIQTSIVTDSLVKTDPKITMTSSQYPVAHEGVFAACFDKENVYHAYPPSSKLPELDATPSSSVPFPSFEPKSSSKRSLTDVTPWKDMANKKQKVDGDETFELPSPDDMPMLVDDGSKPPHSYAELIGMAILRAPNRRLTLAQIYKWISDNFAFYKTSETGWQNSIRHNLSLNKNFIKQERPKDDPGKGNYWAIKPGEERPYLLGKKNPVRRITNPDGSAYMAGLSSELGHFPSASTAPVVGQFTLAPNPVRRSGSRNLDSTKQSDLRDLSSDGTIPASDPALHDEDRDETSMPPPPPTHFRSSPPPTLDICSSPPPATVAPRKDTPPPTRRLAPPSRSGERRSKLGGPNDSGYWSSIESSAARGASQQLLSEIDLARPRIKKGRAEAEIARIRSSSFDSPIKEHLQVKRSVSCFASSSPAKEEHLSTPAVVFKRPPRPPPSVSPNTNLRNHRNRMRALLGSPAKPQSPMPDTNLWSPGLNFGEENVAEFNPYISPYKQSRTPWKPFDDIGAPSNALFNSAFDVFIDAPEEDLSSRGSPEKRSARRPSLVRAATSSGILADVTGTARGTNAGRGPLNEGVMSLSPFLTKSTNLFSKSKPGSPLKKSFSLSSPSRNDDRIMRRWRTNTHGLENELPTDLQLAAFGAEELFGAELLSDGSEEAIDIFQDFGKIGQAPQHTLTADRANGSPVKKTVMGPPARPLRRTSPLKR